MLTERRWDYWDNYLFPSVGVREQFSPGIVEILINDIEPGDRIRVRTRIDGKEVGVEALVDDQGFIGEVDGMRVREALDFSGDGIKKRVEVRREEDGKEKVVFLFEDVECRGLFVWVDQNVL